MFMIPMPPTSRDTAETAPSNTVSMPVTLEAVCWIDVWLKNEKSSALGGGEPVQPAQQVFHLGLRRVVVSDAVATTLMSLTRLAAPARRERRFCTP